MKQTIIKTTFLFFILISFFNCEKEEVTTDQQSNIETVSIEEALDLFSQSSKTSKSSKTNNNLFAIPELDKISQEEIINSNELLTIIPATTFEGVYSRILLIKIDGEIKPVVFSMVKNEELDTPEFSGMIYIHTLEKEYINTLKAENGMLMSRFKKPIENDSSKSHFAKGDEDCWGIACGMHGEEVIINAKRDQRIEFAYVFRFGGGYSDDGGQSWNYGEGQQGGGGGSSGVQQVAETTCNPGYVMDNDGVCVAQVLVEEPETPIIDMVEFLNCIDTSQNATLTIYADQPIANSSLPVSSSGDVGHAFVSITQNGNTVSFGFYPKQKAKSFTAADGAIGNDQNHQYDASVTMNISASTLSNIIDFVNTIPETYNVNLYNCTDYVIDISNFTRLNLPDCYAYYPGAIINGGSSPSVLGQYIKKLPESPNYATNTTTANAPSQSGDCND